MAKTGTEIWMRREGNKFIPESEFDLEQLEKAPLNVTIKVTYTVPRSLPHHKFFFAMLNIVWKNQREPHMFPTVNSLLDAIKIAVGCVREFKDFHGNTHVVPDSISFGKMDQVEFKEFFRSAVNVILTNIIPRCPRKELEQEIYNMLGEAGPEQLERH